MNFFSEYFKYRGIKIVTGMKHLFRNVLTAYFLISFIVFFYIIYFGFMNVNLNDGFRKIIEDSKLYLAIGLSMLSVCVVGLILFFLLQKWLEQIIHLQKIARMIYTNKMYLIDDLEIHNLFTNKKERRKTISYFPKIYYKSGKKSLKVYIALDGSKFHKMGMFNELGKIFEDMFNLEMIEVTEEAFYIKYEFIRDNEYFRLSIKDIRNMEITEKYPLMKNIYWNPTKPAHGLVSGTTGAGKTYFLLALVYMFIKTGSKVYIADPKCSDLYKLKVFIENVGSTDNHIEMLLRKAVEEMDERYKQMESDEIGKDYRNYGFSPVFFVFDEYIAYMDSLDTKARARSKSYVKQLTLKGRQAGVFIILGSQQANAESIDTVIRDQLGLRVALGKMSPEGYRMVFGNTPNKKFRSLKKDGSGHIFLEGVTESIREYYSPLVPVEWNWMEEFRKIMDENVILPER